LQSRQFRSLAVLWIRIGFNADPNPDLAFYNNADLDRNPDPVSETIFGLS
jgi:hypothetical protein